jgi:uncharacterized membrane protein YqjE
MDESWLQRMLARTGWIGTVIALLEIEWRAVSCRLRAFRKNLLIALCMAAIGFILIGISLIALGALLVASWWQEYPLQSLGVLTLLYAGVGVLMIGRSVRRITGPTS